MSNKINFTAKISFLHSPEGMISPSVFNEIDSVSYNLLLEALKLIPVESELNMIGVILQEDAEYCHLLTSVGLLKIKTEFVEFEGDISDMIKIEKRK